MSDPQPAVSFADTRVAVCICTYHRAACLRELLASLCDLDLSGLDAGRVNVIIVDNDPQQENADICTAAAARLPVALHYVQEPQAGVTHARNTAVAQALALGADFVAFIDDDDLPDPDWLVQLLRRQAETQADLVFGVWRPDPNMPAWARRAGIFRDPDKSKSLGAAGRYGLPTCASTCNVMAGRNILERVAAQGPVFDHAFRYSGGEDKDFFIRARQLGASLTTAQDSVINLSHAAERYLPRGLLQRGFKCGCSQVSMARVHGNPVRSLSLRLKALFKLPLVALSLPLTLLSRPLYLHHLFRLGKSAGVLYSSVTNRSFNYYARGDQ